MRGGPECEQREPRWTRSVHWHRMVAAREEASTHRETSAQGYGPVDQGMATLDQPARSSGVSDLDPQCHPADARGSALESSSREGSALGGVQACEAGGKEAQTRTT